MLITKLEDLVPSLTRYSNEGMEIVQIRQGTDKESVHKQETICILAMPARRT